MEDENISPGSLSDTAFKPRERKRPFNRPNLHEDSLAAAFSASLSGQDSLRTEDGGNISAGSLSDTAFKPRERKRPFEKPNYHEDTLAAEFSNVRSSEQESFVLPIRPCNLLKERNCDVTFTASQSKDNSVVSVCSFKKKSQHSMKERIINSIHPNFDVDQSFNETLNHSAYSFSKSSKKPYRFNAPPDLTFGGMSSLEATSQESSCLSSENRSSFTHTNSNIESFSLISTDENSKIESSSNFCADESASQDTNIEQSDDEDKEANVTITDQSSSAGSKSSANVSKQSEMLENDTKSEDNSEYDAPPVSDQSICGESNLSSMSRMSKFRNTGNTFTKNDTSVLTDIPEITLAELHSCPATPLPVTEIGVAETIAEIAGPSNHNNTYTISVAHDSSPAAQEVVPEQVAELSLVENSASKPLTENAENSNHFSGLDESVATLKNNSEVSNTESMTIVEASLEIDVELDNDSCLVSESIRNMSQVPKDLDICESQESVVLAKAEERQNHLDLLKNPNRRIDFSMNSSSNTISQTSETDGESATISQNIAVSDQPDERRKHLDLLKSPNRHIDFNIDSTSQITEVDEENAIVSQESVLLSRPEERRNHLVLLEERSCHIDFNVDASQDTVSQGMEGDCETATVSQESVVLISNGGQKKGLDLLRDKRCSINFSVNQSQSTTLSETVFATRQRFQFDAARVNDLTFSIPTSQRSVESTRHDVSSVTYSNFSALVEEESATDHSGQNAGSSCLTFETVEPSQLESEKLLEVEISNSRLYDGTESNVGPSLQSAWSIPNVKTISDLIHSRSEMSENESEGLEDTLTPEEDVIDLMQPQSNVSKNELREDELVPEEDVIDLMHPQNDTIKNESLSVLNESEDRENVIDLMHPQNNVSKNKSQEGKLTPEEDTLDLRHPLSNTSKNDFQLELNEPEDTENVIDLMHPQSDSSRKEFRPQEVLESNEDVSELGKSRSNVSKNTSQLEENAVELNTSVIDPVRSNISKNASEEEKELGLEEDVIDLLHPQTSVSVNRSQPIQAVHEVNENVIDLLQPQSNDTINSGNLSRLMQSESEVQSFSKSSVGKESEVPEYTYLTVGTLNSEHLSRFMRSETQMESSKSTIQKTEIQDDTRGTINVEDPSCFVKSEIKEGEMQSLMSVSNANLPSSRSNVSNSPNDVEELSPTSPGVSQETPVIPMLKPRRSLRNKSSQNNTKSSPAAQPSIPAPSTDTPIVPVRKSGRLSKRKLADVESDSDGGFIFHENDLVEDSSRPRKSTRLSTKAGFSVRFVDTVHSISTIEGCADSVSEKVEPPLRSSSSTYTKSYTSSEPSLVNKLFAENDENKFARPTLTAPKAKVKTKSKKKAKCLDQLLPFLEDEEIEALPKKPYFPRLADYIHRGLYEVLIEKLRPKYGIETNAKVVALARAIKAHIETITNSEEHYPEEEVVKFKRLMAKQGIVETNYDFWFFCANRFPASFRRKAFPLFVFKDGKRQLRDETHCFERILSNGEDGSN